jgi:hypothetical protein
VFSRVKKRELRETDTVQVQEEETIMAEKFDTLEVTFLRGDPPSRSFVRVKGEAGYSVCIRRNTFAATPAAFSFQPTDDPDEAHIFIPWERVAAVRLIPQER